MSHGSWDRFPCDPKLTEWMDGCTQGSGMDTGLDQNAQIPLNVIERMYRIHTVKRKKPKIDCNS